MSTPDEFNSYGEELERTLRLQTPPVAVKMLESEADIPPEAFRPDRDKGEHYAQCQAVALSRRDGLTIAMCKNDNWCPGPMFAYGIVPLPDNHPVTYDRFEYGKYVGILTAPLTTASFLPDVVIIYSDTNQLRTMLLVLKEEDRPLVKSNFFPFSCAYSVTSPILRNEYWINLPDPGEYVRAMVQAGEMMFSIPAARLPGYMAELRKFDKESMFAHEQMMIRPDFPQPDLYKNLFENWGMKHSE
jgi:uncharacterized protein (DUF169 family)